MTTPPFTSSPDPIWIVDDARGHLDAVAANGDDVLVASHEEAEDESEDRWSDWLARRTYAAAWEGACERALARKNDRRLPPAAVVLARARNVISPPQSGTCCTRDLGCGAYVGSMDVFKKFLGIGGAVALVVACDPVVETYETAESYDAVIVEVGNGDVNVIASADDKIRVTGTLTFSDEVPAYEVEADGRGNLVVSGKCAPTDSTCLTDIDVELPPDVRIVVLTDAGHVSADGIRSGGELTSNSGNLTISDVAGSFTLTANDGKIEGSDVIAEEIMATTMSGAIDLTFSGAPTTVTANTGEGDITIRLPPSVAYFVDAWTGRGIVEVDVPQESASLYMVTARADVGDIGIYNNCEGGSSTACP